MEPKNITTEEFREYVMRDGSTYRIDRPQQLFIGKTAHRVVDVRGITHCVPSPGNGDVVAIRWEAVPPVSF